MVLRAAVLAIAQRGVVRRAVTSGVGRAVALRFVAGETLENAVEVTRALNRMGAAVSIDYLGENVHDAAQADAARRTYDAVLAAISAGPLRANVSVKLTQLGLDLDPALAYEHAERIVAAAADTGTTVTLDMEDHRYTDRTIDICVRLAEKYADSVGVAVQAYLRRTPADLERLVAARVQVRLCKGAYKEPRSIAYQRREEVRDAFRALTERLARSTSYPMIATHDQELIEHALTTLRDAGRPATSFEFQMLYGVRRALQKDLLARDVAVRIYVPFGSQWYPYLMRRIGERPANLRFFLEALARG